MQKTLAIYYIATAEYKEGFKYFKENLHLFMPEMDKTVIVLSDGLEEWNDKEENGIKYKVFHIDHYPWPVITMFKMYHILNHKVDCDYACYFNGDIEINTNFDFKNNVEYFNYKKLNVSHHVNLNGKCNKNFSRRCLPWEMDNPQSLSYIGKRYYDYFSAGFFFGPSSIFFRLCEDVDKWTKKDLIKNIIPKWHDETYFNKWCFKYKRAFCYSNWYLVDDKHINILNAPFIINRKNFKKEKFLNGFSCKIVNTTFE